MTFGSLFSGIGGIDLGLERAGMECRWQVEIDPYCRKVLAKHWPEVKRHGDIRAVTELESVDLIAGGFPCQDISYAGRGAGIDGERSGLWSEMLRIIRLVQPRLVLVENVPALLARGLDRVLGELAASGFDAQWDCLPAAAFGAPHIRDRVFILAYAERLRGREYGATNPAWQSLHTAVGEESALRIGSGGSALADTDSAGLAHVQRRAQFTAHDGGTAPSRASWWDSEPDVGRVADGVPARVDRLRGLGNAVVPQVAEWLGRRILEAS